MQTSSRSDESRSPEGAAHWSAFRGWSPERLRGHFGYTDKIPTGLNFREDVKIIRCMRCDVRAIIGGMDGLTLKEVPSPGWVSALSRNACDKGSATIWLDDSSNEPRKRFAIAHELGHLLVHNGLLYRAAGFVPSTREKAQAIEYAMRLLMPEKFMMYFTSVGAASAASGRGICASIRSLFLLESHEEKERYKRLWNEARSQSAALLGVEKAAYDQRAADLFWRRRL